MAACLEIGNDWQSHRSSFTFDFSLMESETTTNERQSPRISFSLYISQTEYGTSPEKLTRDVTDVNYDADFEFCINGQNSIIGETLLPVADERLVAGQILPLIHGPVEARAVPVSHHLALESLRCVSPVRLTSSPSKILSSCWRNVSSKSFGLKPPNKLNEMMFKPSNKEYICAEKSSTSFKVVDQSQRSSTKSLWPFSRSCRTGGELKGTGLFRSLSFSRSHSTIERKYKAENSGCAAKEIETVEAWRISNKAQPDERYYGELKPRFDAKGAKEETKAEQYTVRSGKLGSPGMRKGMSGQRSTGRFSRNDMSMARNLESPPPGKTMADGYLFVKGNNSMVGRGGARVSPVVNVHVCNVHPRGSWNNGGGLFGIFSKREKKRPQTSANNSRHHSRASTNRKRSLNPIG